VAVQDFRGGATVASAAIAVASATPAGTGDAAAARLPATRAPSIAIPGKQRKGALRLRVGCAFACTARATLTAKRSLARTLRLGKRRVVGTRTKKLTPGTTTFHVFLSGRARSRLRRTRLRWAKVTLTLAVTDAKGRTSRIRRDLRIRV
jgi:hypothetical protein